jgi:hypothetical protein|tara:strand:+ start:2171 stop:4597 length:2427 start_codon:yes stop_codon:yes gene_type:complete
MAIRNKDGTFTANRDMNAGQFLNFLFNPFAENFNTQETNDMSLVELNRMREGELQADTVADEYLTSNKIPDNWNSELYGDFGQYVAERNEAKQKNTLSFSKHVLPLLDETQQNKFYPDLFKDVLKQSGNEDFKRINLSDVSRSAQRNEDGSFSYNPSVTTMAPNQDGTFAIRENGITMDGKNERDGGQAIVPGAVTGNDLDVVYDAKKYSLMGTAPAGTEAGVNITNQLTSRGLDISDISNDFSIINNANSPRELVLNTIANLGDSLDTSTDEIKTTGGTGDSLAQTWQQAPGAGYKEKLENFLAGDRVIEVDESKFSKTGFSLDERNATGAELLNQLKAAKGYVVDGVKGPYLSGSEFNRPDISVSKLLDNIFQRGAGQRVAERKKERRTELLGKDYDLKNVEEAFTKEQWSSLNETQKKEAVALLSEMAVNNTKTLLGEKIGEIKKGPAGLSSDESRTYITNNKLYRDLATADNLNIILKNSEISEDFKNLSPQDFTNKYTIEKDGKRVIDEAKVLGNEVTPESKVQLNNAISDRQVNEFAKLIKNNDIAGIEKLVNSINISAEDNSALTEALVAVNGDFRKMTAKEADRKIVRKYVLSSLATLPKDAPIRPFLTNISIGTYIETGMLNTQGSQLAKDMASQASSIPEVEFSQPFSDAYSELRDINKEYRTGKLENPEMKWQESTKALANMKAQMNLGNPAKRLAMRTAYGQEVINSLKEFAASVEPDLWDEITTLTFAKGGQFKLFGNEVDAIAERNDAGEVIGLKIGDTVLTVNDMKGQFSPEFINAFVAAADINTESQRQRNR